MQPTALRNSAPPERAAVFFGYIAGVVGLAAVITVLGDVRPFTTPGDRTTAAIFPSVCFTFSILVLYGLGPAIVVQTAAVVATATLLRHAPWRAGFNAGQYALSLAGAEMVLREFDFRPFAPGGVPDSLDVLYIILAATAWFVVNYVLVTTMVWLRFGDGWWAVFRRSFGYELLSGAALLLLGAILAAATNANPWLISLVLVPLYAVNRMARLSNEQAQLAGLDPLTGLANRKALMSAVTEQVTAHAERAAEGLPERHIALLVLDLDRFKDVNDALGHEVGDRLLVEVARRLSGTVRRQDLVARLGGDEFAVLAPGIVDATAALALATRIQAALSSPVPLDGLPLDVGGSIGIAMYPEHGEDFASLMRHADVAMYEAKTRGDGITLYVPEADQNSPERLGLLADLRAALDDPTSGLTMYYQPQVEMCSGDVVGVEALLRWCHPKRGMVDPDELIRVAEHSAVMRLLTMRVIEDVVAQLAKWKAEGLTLRASINVSVRDLHGDEIVDRLAERLVHYRVGPEQVQLEITEGALMADPRRVLATLQRLHRIGVELSLDDYGTGYSSMQHLRRLPLSEVKIDRSFVLGMSTDSDDEAIVRSIIELAGALGLRVVAEGVEDDRTRRMLVSVGCQTAQGWFYARPMPADDLSAWLARYRPPALLLNEQTGRG
ncbi:MAG TPA: EAL domain-containing protein [Micromonosporaceae bacterium]